MENLVLYNLLRFVEVTYTLIYMWIQINRNGNACTEVMDAMVSDFCVFH